MFSDDDLKKALLTPKDWTQLSNEERASTLALSFIGFIARPINIPKDILEKCCEAFNNNRGKVENEIESILIVLNKELR